MTKVSDSPPLPRKAFVLASAGIVAGGALWGIYWIPVRAFASTGLDGPWPGMVIYIVTCAILAPFAALRWRNLLGHWHALAIAGLLTGAAFSTYSTAIVLTDVVRAVLLFYLTPVWGTALGVLFLGERLTRARIAGILFALCGLGIIALGGDGRGLNSGDIIAIASGIFWAVGSMQVYRLEDTPIVDIVIAFALGALAVTLATYLILGDRLGNAPTLENFSNALPLAILVAVYVIPMLWLTIWPATVLTPGRVGLLLMSDAVIGVISAALFAGEHFGYAEAAGTVLIVTGAALEVSRGAPADAN